MNQILTLKKDLWRLWPVAVLTCLMLAILANADRWRADWMPSPMEGWMNLVLSAAWACMTALVVLEDPLVGDNQFWMTRPYRWSALLSAKLALVVLMIHLPLFLADVYVLGARGFPPLLHLDVLLVKQFLLFGALTLPAIAVATLVRSFVHFVVVLFVIATLLAFLSGGLQTFPVYSHETSQLRDNIVRLLLVCTSTVVVGLRYSRRRSIAGLVIGIAGALAAAAMFSFLPVRAEYRADSRETPEFSLREASADERAPSVYMGSSMHSVLVPIRVSSGARSGRFQIRFSEVELIADNGDRLASVQPTPNRPFEKIDLIARAYAVQADLAPEWYVLTFSNSAWERWKNARVRWIRGWAGVEFYRTGETTTLSSQSSTVVPGVGRCSIGTVDGRFSEPLLKVLCESTRSLPAASVQLRHDASQRVWPGGLNAAQTHAPGPNRIWLSPIYRGQAFFRLTNSIETAPSAQWLVPASYVTTARVEVTPRVVTGRALAQFEFANVVLSRLRTPESQRQ